MNFEDGASLKRSVGALAHRWRSPQGDTLDLVPVGDMLGAGQGWDMSAWESAQSVQLNEEVSIRIPSAPILLALKWAAFDDRGRSDPQASDDLEDILALIVVRPNIAGEVAAADPNVRVFVVGRTVSFLGARNREDCLPLT
jgi:hypothetical protein